LARPLNIFFLPPGKNGDGAEKFVPRTRNFGVRSMWRGDS